METLPIELKIKILLSFQHIIRFLFISHDFHNIVTSFFLVQKMKIPKYKILSESDYQILMKFKPCVKTLIIQGHDLDLKKINLIKIDYTSLTLKDVNLTLNDINILDANMSWKCKKITLSKLILPDNFIYSLGCLYECETFGYRPINGYSDNEYNHVLEFMKTLPKLQKIVLLHGWFMDKKQIQLLSGYKIIKFEDSVILRDILSSIKNSKLYGISCLLYSPGFGLRFYGYFYFNIFNT